MAAAAVGLVAACAAPRQIEYEERLERADLVERHAIHDERIQQLMRGLDRLANERLPKALDVESERSFRANEVAQAARALSESAALILAIEVGLDPSDRADFDALANSLRAQALALSEDADSLSLDAIHARLADLDKTCRSCHDRFRFAEMP